MNPTLTRATLALATSLTLLAPLASQASTIVTVEPGLPADGTYTFTGDCHDCQPSGAPYTPVTATLTVAGSDYANWSFSYSSALFPNGVVATQVLGYLGDSQLDGLSVMDLLFQTAPTAVPANLAWTGMETSTLWSFSTRVDGDLYFQLNAVNNNADFGANGNWAPGTPPTAVPEPGSFALGALALAGLAATRRRKTAA